MPAKDFSLTWNEYNHFQGVDMKAQLRNQVAALFLLAPAAVTFTALPSTVAAQAATPQVHSFQVASDHGLEPGSRLQFTLQGTPNARASIRIRGARDPIPLAETSRGIYTGRYVINRADRIDEDSQIRAILRRGNLRVAASYSFPPDIANLASAPPPPQLRIERFHMASVDRIEPGAELRFTLEGMPGAVAFVDLPGIERNVRLRETRPGHYEGSYTIRRSDDLNTRAPVVATLRAGDRFVTSNLAQPLVAAGPQNVPIRILSHSNNSQVDGGWTRVRGRTAPFASVEIKVDAVPPVIGQFGVAQRVFSERVQADANGHFDFSFSPPFPVPGTRYDIAMVASKADVTTEARLVLYQRQG
jgi:hypothetical protein